MISITTHNGKFTIRNPKTGEHRTFQIKTIKAENSPLRGKRIVSMLFGPDNMSDYRGFGFVTDTGIALWKKSDTDFFRKCARILENPSLYPVEAFVEGKCIRCNRTLTHPDSILSGIGPECAQKI